MSSKRKPRHDAPEELDSAFAALLAGEVPLADDLRAVDDACAGDEDLQTCGFDIDRLIESVRGSAGVETIDTVIEVPLEGFLEASRHEALRELRLAADDAGRPFLTAVVFSTSGRPVLLVSVSFG